MAPSKVTLNYTLRIILQHHSPSRRFITATPLLQHAHAHLPLPAPPHHGFHTSRVLSSALFNLGGLSTSRENQFLSKEKGRPRTEFSPHLELIRSSEVDTQQRPNASESTPVAVNPASTLIDTRKFREDVAKNVVAMPKAKHEALLAEIATLKEKLGGAERDLEHRRNQRDWVIAALICGAIYMAGYEQGSWYLGGARKGTQQSEQDKQRGGEESSRWVLPQDVEHTMQIQINSESRSWRGTLFKLFWAGKND